MVELSIESNKYRSFLGCIYRNGLNVTYVLIIGAGLAGLAAALCLKQRNGISSVIYEILPKPTTLGGEIMILCNGTRLLDRLGVYKPLFSSGR